MSQLRGPQGPQGPRGLTGATGPRGPAGPKGDRGDISSLHELTDVNLLAPVAGQVLQFDGSSWVNAAVEGGTGYATETYVDTAISSLVNGAPGVLDTLKELSDSLNGDSNFATTVTGQLALKANSSDLAIVATSGSYNDLANLPTIPVDVSDLTDTTGLLGGSGATLPANASGYLVNDGNGNLSWAAGDGTFSGNYNDLTNKPTIPADISDLTDTSGILTGNVKLKEVPVSNIGTNGDLKGNIAVDSESLFVAYRDYDGETIYPNVGINLLTGSNYLYLNKDNWPGPQVGWTVKYNPTGQTSTVVAVDDLGTKWGVTTGGEFSNLFLDDQNATFTFTKPAGAIWKEIPFNLAAVATSGSYNDLTNKPTIPADVSELTDTTGLLGGGGTANTGDVTFDGVKVIGAGTASGDGGGYSTLELVPDNNLYGNDQYLIVDPTGPNHIHIRAGGTQDQSNAQLFLGGENTHVTVNDIDGIARLNHSGRQQLFSASISAGIDFSTAEWTTDGVNNFITFNDVQQTTLNAIWGLNGSENSIEIYDGVNYTTITGINGSSTPGLGQPATLTVNQAPPVSPTPVLNAFFSSYGIVSTYIEVDGTDIRMEARDDLRMFSRDIFLLANYSTTDPVRIATNYNNNEQSWDFRVDGVLELPAGGDIVRNGSSIIPNLAAVATSGNYNDLSDRPNLFYRQVLPPASSTGADGDLAGDIAFDSGYVYYCKADYTGGTIVYNTTLSQTTTNSNVYYVSKTAIAGTPAAGWTLQVSGGPLLNITGVVDSFGDWQLTTDGISETHSAGSAVQLVDTAGNIWKRIAWSGDTW